jgi:hypothetical protein
MEPLSYRDLAPANRTVVFLPLILYRTSAEQLVGLGLRRRRFGQELLVHRYSKVIEYFFHRSVTKQNVEGAGDVMFVQPIVVNNRSGDHASYIQGAVRCLQGIAVTGSVT